MGGVLVRTNEISCGHAKPRPLTKIVQVHFFAVYVVNFIVLTHWVGIPYSVLIFETKCVKTHCWGTPGGGALNFLSGRGCVARISEVWGLRTDICLWKGGLVSGKFPNFGACELKISKFGGLWAENFQIWGLVSWKFPNLGACELKLWWKLRLLRLNFPNFLKRGSCELTLLLEMGPLRAAGEAWKGGLQGRTSLYPLSRSVPPRVRDPQDEYRSSGGLNMGTWNVKTLGKDGHWEILLEKTKQNKTKQTNKRFNLDILASRACVKHIWMKQRHSLKMSSPS